MIIPKNNIDKRGVVTAIAIITFMLLSGTGIMTVQSKSLGGPKSVNDSFTRSFEVINILPNPFKEKFVLKLNCKKAMKVSLDIIAADGKLFHHGVLDCLYGDNTYYYIQKDFLSAGDYIVSCSDRDGYKVSMNINKKD